MQHHDNTTHPDQLRAVEKTTHELWRQTEELRSTALLLSEHLITTSESNNQITRSDIGDVASSIYRHLVTLSRGISLLNDTLQDMTKGGLA